MKDIFKILLKYKWKITLVLFLLVLQAYCNLQLPTYTSNIVDIGIENSGIEYLVPKIINEDEYKFILKMLNEKDKNKLNKSYKYIDNNKNKYEIPNKEGIYELKKIQKKEMIYLENILLYPLFLYTNQSETINNINIKENYKGNEMLISGVVKNHIKEIYTYNGLDIEKMSMNYIYKTGGYMLLVTLIALIVTIFTIYYSSKISAYFSKDLRKKVIEKIMTFESEEIKEFNISSLITRCTNDIVQIGVLITVFLRIIVYAPIMGIGAYIKVANNNLSWVIGISVLLILNLMIILFVVVVPKFKKFQDLLDKLNLVCRETLKGLPVIRAFANEKQEEKRFEKANEELTKNGLFVSKTMAIMSPTLTVLMNSVSILIVWVGANELDKGTMQVGSLIAFISYTMQIIMAFLMVSMVAIMLPRAIVSIKRISEIFNKKVNIKNKENTIKINETINEIEFKDVFFKYPGSRENILKNINFKTKKGTTTAFIGSTGSGKSTLINLIPRFFDVSSGKILIDGTNIQDINIQNLRGKIGYAPQKSQLFTGTIESNIAFGQKKKNKELINEAARISQSLDFINETEEKFKRLINENGINISGGQKGRLSIARAIAINPEIYIFDDSFSALDYKTDIKLRKELKKITKDKIVFLVTQRISSVMSADQIIVLNNGEIVGLGTHEELLNNCEIYKEIKISQLGE